jgi:type II secretory pathway pseudopilin PulG
VQIRVPKFVMSFASRPRSEAAFTLIELMSVVGISLVLLAVSVGAISKVNSQGKMAREIAAGRNLISAYHAYAADNDGRYLPGMDFTVSKVWFEPYGRDISMMHAANRYPFRLAPYFNYSLKGTVFVNDIEKQIAKIANPGSSMHDYVVSAFPTFGINYYFVGGCVTGTAASPSLMYPGDCVSRQGMADRGSLLVFASGGSTDGSVRVEGYNILTPPRLFSSNWSSSPWSKGGDPGLHGNVDARYDGKAVCVFLDGSVQLKTIEELRDMRLWSRIAAENNDPDYQIVP